MYGSMRNYRCMPSLYIRVHEVLTMKSDNCVEITDAKRIEMKSGLTEPGEHRDSGFIISAFILIGLGVGLLVDHLGSGFLIGLGLGFVGSALLPLVKKSSGGDCPATGRREHDDASHRSLPDLHRDRDLSWRRPQSGRMLLQDF